MITVKNLSKKYDPRGIAGLNDVSFTLKEGEILGLMGPNGSGKTTLINMLSGSLESQSGSIKIDGEVSFFPSHEITDDLNVQKFLVEKVKPEVPEEKKIQLARDLADTFEFTFQLRQKLSELSSGQKQKVLLAAELINDPSLLLMDEPFAHLDPFTRKDILNGLFSYIRQQGITVLWVTHELDEALRFSTHIGLMNFGKLEQLSSPMEFIKKPKNLFVAQFAGYNNFFPVKGQGGKTQTPWGLWDHSLNVPEAIMVVPDRAWKLDPESAVKFQVIEAYPSNQGVTYRLKHLEQVLTLTASLKAEVLEHKCLIGLSPIWQECFVIPL